MWPAPEPPAPSRSACDFRFTSARRPSSARCCGRFSPPRNIRPKIMAKLQKTKAERRGVGASVARNPGLHRATCRAPCGSSPWCRSSPGSALFCMWLYFPVAVAHNVFGAADDYSAPLHRGRRMGGHLLRNVLSVCFVLLVLPARARPRSSDVRRRTAFACCAARSGLLSVAVIHDQFLAVVLDGRRRHRLGQHALHALRDSCRIVARSRRLASTWAFSTSSS